MPNIEITLPVIPTTAYTILFISLVDGFTRAPKNCDLTPTLYKLLFTSLKFSKDVFS